jgi:hypothetical protein
VCALHLRVLVVLPARLHACVCINHLYSGKDTVSVTRLRVCLPGPPAFLRLSRLQQPLLSGSGACLSKAGAREGVEHCVMLNGVLCTQQSPSLPCEDTLNPRTTPANRVHLQVLCLLVHSWTTWVFSELEFQMPSVAQVPATAAAGGSSAGGTGLVKLPAPAIKPTAGTHTYSTRQQSLSSEPALSVVSAAPTSASRDVPVLQSSTTQRFIASGTAGGRIAAAGGANQVGGNSRHLSIADIRQHLCQAAVRTGLTWP